MIRITDNIKYLPATNNPLSADVYFIEGDKRYYFYDVGNNDNSLHHINQATKDKIVIISHYHKDHTGNIEHIGYRNLYVGRKTYETIGKGEVVEDSYTIYDGIKLEILHCPSPHTDGSLIVNINNEYALIADLYFTRPPFDSDKASQMIEYLRNLDTKFFVVSHQEDGKIVPKGELIEELSTYFGQ